MLGIDSSAPVEFHITSFTLLALLNETYRDWLVSINRGRVVSDQ